MKKANEGGGGRKKKRESGNRNEKKTLGSVRTDPFSTVTKQNSLRLLLILRAA